MTQTFRTKAIAVGTGALLALSLSGAFPMTGAQANDAYPPGVTPVKCKIKLVKNKTHIKINMGPNQPGDRYYTFKVDVKKNGKWYRYLKNYKTQGPKETKVLNRKKGTYRAHCNGKFGYISANSTSVKVKK